MSRRQTARGSRAKTRAITRVSRHRQIQMIGLGGAIGTGLFLGAGGRLASAGPGLFLVYAVCGIFVFFILRALGELVLHRPSSGSFVSYAREFFGEKVAFVAGWMYFINWAMTGIVDTTAIAHYCHYWTRVPRDSAVDPRADRAAGGVVDEPHLGEDSSANWSSGPR